MIHSLTSWKPPTLPLFWGYKPQPPRLTLPLPWLQCEIYDSSPLPCCYSTVHIWPAQFNHNIRYVIVTMCFAYSRWQKRFRHGSRSLFSCAAWATRFSSSSILSSSNGKHGRILLHTYQDIPSWWPKQECCRLPILSLDCPDHHEVPLRQNAHLAQTPSHPSLRHVATQVSGKC